MRQAICWLHRDFLEGLINCKKATECTVSSNNCRNILYILAFLENNETEIILKNHTFRSTCLHRFVPSIRASIPNNRECTGQDTLCIFQQFPDDTLQSECILLKEPRSGDDNQYRYLQVKSQTCKRVNT